MATHCHIGNDVTIEGYTRPPVVAGMFYPADATMLQQQVTTLLSGVPNRTVKGNVVAIVVPHAGYQYSGTIAAHGYRLLQKTSFETVVVVAPSHREYFDGISVFSGAAYATPLGRMSVDVELREALLANNSYVESSMRGHGDEHAIEVQLPFLQLIAQQVKILPIVIGDQRRTYCFHLGKKLADILRDKNVVLIASTDLSHYYSSDKAEKFDSIARADIATFNYEQLMTDLETERTEACGGGPTVAVLLAAKDMGANHVEILSHGNSGDVGGDHQRVVGYMSAVISKTA